MIKLTKIAKNHKAKPLKGIIKERFTLISHSWKEWRSWRKRVKRNIRDDLMRCMKGSWEKSRSCLTTLKNCFKVRIFRRSKGSDKEKRQRKVEQGLSNRRIKSLHINLWSRGKRRSCVRSWKVRNIFGRGWIKFWM